jgi:branched-chain amino acid transport system ATP-binding protein
MPACSIEARDVGVRFGDFHAVSGVTLGVGKGTIHSVIGPNGAGKTTLFNALSGVLPPNSGRICYDGRDVTNLSSWRRVRLGMARSFQVTNIFQDLTVRENLRLGVQAVVGLQAWQFWRSPVTLSGVQTMTERLIDRLGLGRSAGLRAGDLSHGGQRMLEIGMALASDPQVLFLDEPLAGMGIDDVHQMKLLIAGLAPDRTVMLIEHNMSVVLDISHRITVLAQGRKIAEGTPAEVRQDAAVREAYLGSGA